MGAKEDAQAALDHRSYVYSQTNDAQQRRDADENYQRAAARAASDGSPQFDTGGRKQPPSVLGDMVGSVDKALGSK